jgi:uncharacterized membrane protein
MGKLKHVISYELLHIVIIGTIAYLVTGNAFDSTLIAIIEPLIMGSIHYILERFEH